MKITVSSPNESTRKENRKWNLCVYRSLLILVISAQALFGQGTLDLTGQAGIFGNVTDEQTGLPLGDINVDIYRWDPAGDYWYYYSYSYTDANGNYSISEPDAGAYRIGFSDNSGIYIAEHYNNAPDLDAANDIIFTTGQTLTGIDVSLATASLIEGTVTADQSGLPLGNINIKVYRWNPLAEDWSYVSFAYTDANGNYSAGGLSAGTYRIGFSDSRTGRYITEYYNNTPDLDTADDITIGSGQAQTGIDASLSIGSRIEGTVTDEQTGLPLGDINLDVYRWNPVGENWYYFSYSFTDANGNYSLSVPDVGAYRIRFSDNSVSYAVEYYNNAPDLHSANDITVGTSQTLTGIDASLATASRIEGTVTADQSGLPLGGINVEFYRWNPVGEDWSYVSFSFTDANGSYSAGGLPAGTYRIRFLDDLGNYASEYYDNGPALESADDIIVTSGQTLTGIDASLATASRIKGTVTAEQTGLPLGNINVDIYRWDPAGEDWSYFSFSFTDANGNYSAGGLSAGTYRIRFLDDSGGHATEYYNNAPDLYSANDITVGTIQTVTGIDAALETPVASGYDGWAASYGLDGEFLSPGATPMKDGLSNLLKYAFRLHPGEIATGTDRVLVPGSGISGIPHISPEGKFLRVEYVRRKNSPDLTYQVEFCTSLAEGGPQGWQPVVETIPPNEIDSEWERVIVYDEVPVSGGSPRFGRVKAKLQGGN